MDPFSAIAVLTATAVGASVAQEASHGRAQNRLGMMLGMAQRPQLPEAAVAPAAALPDEQPELHMDYTLWDAFELEQEDVPVLTLRSLEFPSTKKGFSRLLKRSINEPVWDRIHRTWIGYLPPMRIWLEGTVDAWIGGPSRNL